MKKINKCCLCVLLLICLSFISSCDREGEYNIAYKAPDPIPFPATKDLSFSISFPLDSDLNNESLKIISFYKTSNVPKLADRGNETIPVIVTDTEKSQLVIMADSQNNPLFFSYVDPLAKSPTISSEEIAKALVLLNPYVIQLPAEQRTDFLDNTVLSTAFPQLVSLIEELLTRDPHNLIDPNTHPEVVTRAFVVVRETFENMTTSHQAFKKDIGRAAYLRVLDKAGNELSFENPFMTGYGVEWVNYFGHKKNIFIEGKQGILTFQFAWPPVVITLPVESETINASDGRFKSIFYKGFNIDVDNWWLPYIPGLPDNLQFSKSATIAGTATWYNAFISIDILIDTITGKSIASNIMDIIGRIVKVADLDDIYDFAIALRRGDPVELLSAIVRFMKDNWDDLAYSIWSDSPGLDTAKFLEAAEVLIKNIAQALKLVDWANHHAPFIWDMIFAPWKVEYCVIQENGILDECSEYPPLIPPIASLSIKPINPYIGDSVIFDASESTDDRTVDLRYRFDFEGDGNWDTNWSEDSSANYVFTTSGNYNAIVEVMDEDGLTGIANYYFTVNERAKAISTALVIDKSGSMNGQPLIDAKDGAKIYVGYMGSADRAAVISFDSIVTINQVFTDDVNLIIHAIENIQVGGTTAFYDAVYNGISETAKEVSSRSRAVIALTDGADNASKFNVVDVINYALKEGIPIYTIGLNGYGFSQATENILILIAKKTGGLYFYAPDSQDLKRIYDTIAGIRTALRKKKDFE